MFPTRGEELVLSKQKKTFRVKTTADKAATKSSPAPE